MIFNKKVWEDDLKSMQREDVGMFYSKYVCSIKKAKRQPDARQPKAYMKRKRNRLYEEYLITFEYGCEGTSGKVGLTVQSHNGKINGRLLQAMKDNIKKEHQADTVLILNIIKVENKGRKFEKGRSEEGIKAPEGVDSGTETGTGSTSEGTGSGGKVI